MVKRLKLATRAFGGEPGTPDVAALAAWVAEHRGRMADITTFQLDRSLTPQLDAGIMTPCAGGKFYAGRIRQCIAGISDNRATGELHLDARDIIEDAAGLVVQKKGAWCAIPAPHVLGITDTYYDNAAEWTGAICDMYRALTRAMRDTGVPAHVLVCDTMDEAELAALSGHKIFFFQAEPGRDDLARLMEHQRQVAVRSGHLEKVLALMDEYTLRKVFIVDPDRESIDLALSHLDADQVVAGGYCTDAGADYWNDLVAAAVYER